jgi:hypothetical protein
MKPLPFMMAAQLPQAHRSFWLKKHRNFFLVTLPRKADLDLRTTVSYSDICCFVKLNVVGQVEESYAAGIKFRMDNHFPLLRNPPELVAIAPASQTSVAPAMVVEASAASSMDAPVVPLVEVPLVEAPLVEAPVGDEPMVADDQLMDLDVPDILPDFLAEFLGPSSQLDFSMAESWSLDDLEAMLPPPLLPTGECSFLGLFSFI